MACAVAAPLLEPSGDFPAWLEAQGVNAEVARAMDSELGIRDYGVLRACVGDGLVRAELLATARDRLPFGFYAVLRRVVKALRGADTHDGGKTPPRSDDATVSSPGDVTLVGLVDVLLTLFSGLSKELLLSVRRLDKMTNDEYVVASAPSTGDIYPDWMTEEMHPREENAKAGKNSMTVTHGSKRNLMENLIKTEPLEDTADDIKRCVVPSQTLEQSFDEHTSNLIIDNVITLPDSGAYLASCAAEDETHLLPREVLDETQQDEAASTSVTRNRSPTLKNPHGTISVVTTQNHPPPVSEIQPHEIELVEAHPAGSPQAESSGMTLHRCDVCKDTFLSLSELDAHLRTHTGKKVHRCAVCGRIFLQATGLTIHLRTHKDVSPYTCGVCGHGFCRSSDLNIHLSKHKNDKPFPCEVCGRAYCRLFEWKVHMRTHVDEKPHHSGVNT